MESTVMTDEMKHTLQNMVKNIVFVDSEEDLKPFLCQSCHQIAILHHIAKCGHIFCEKCYFKIYQKSCLVDDCDNVLIDEAHQGSCGYLMEALLAKQLQKNEDIGGLQKMKDDILECSQATEDLQDRFATLEEFVKALDQNGKKLKVDLVLTEDQLTADMEKFVASEIEKHAEMQKTEIKLQISEQIDVLRTELKTQEYAQQQQFEKQEMDHKQQSENYSQELFNKLQELEKTNENLQNELQYLKDAMREADKVQMEMKNKIQVLESQRKSQSQNQMINSSSEFLWEIPRFHEVFKNLKKCPADVDIESSNFPTVEIGYQMRAKLKCYKEYLSMYVSFTEEVKAANPVVYFHRRTFIIVDQSNQLEKQDVVRSWEPKFGSKLAQLWMKGYWGSLQLVPISLLEKNRAYLKNDALLIKIIIEPLAILYRQIAINDGILFWKIDDYRRKKQAEIDGVLDGVRSDYFYSNQRGYRLQLELCLNGYGDGNRGEYLSAFVWFRRGEWDDFLSKKFPHTITVTIYDQLPSEEASIPLTYSYSFSGIKNRCFSRMVSQSKVEQPKYLKNDSLLIQVAVMAE